MLWVAETGNLSNVAAISQTQEPYNKTHAHTCKFIFCKADTAQNEKYRAKIIQNDMPYTCAAHYIILAANLRFRKCLIYNHIK